MVTVRQAALTRVKTLIRYLDTSDEGSAERGLAAELWEVMNGDWAGITLSFKNGKVVLSDLLPMDFGILREACRKLAFRYRVRL